MKILIVGNGGREHALAWGIHNSASYYESNSVMFVTTGNPGINKLCKPKDIKPDDIDAISEFCTKEKIDLVVAGPEIPLSLGLADELLEKGIQVFGPTKSASEIESSKIFAKDIMAKYGIPTASSNHFNPESIDEAIDFTLKAEYPLVIKADGLAAGKGVIIAENENKAKSTIIEMSRNLMFGDSGKKFLIEKYLEGYELSVFAVTDGTDYVILPTSQDHKKIGVGDTGNNTGGMGAYSPADYTISYETLNEINHSIIEPLIKGMNAEGRTYKGCLYCGLMISKTEDGKAIPNVIEFNCRFGDPETQAVVPLIKSDFLELLMKSAAGGIKDYKPEIHEKYCCCVIASSGGYPAKYETGKIISGIGNDTEESIVFHSGTKSSSNNILTAGGRVLSVTGLSAKSMDLAITNAYHRINNINFENMYFRKDIGYKYSKLVIR